MKPINNLPQGGIDPCNAAEWLADKISHYQAEVTRLEAEARHVESELLHAKVLLRGHQTWLQDIERKAGRQ